MDRPHRKGLLGALLAGDVIHFKTKSWFDEDVGIWKCVH